MEPSTTDTKPPYGGFAAFWNFIAQLHDYDHMPAQLDRSVMGNRGGSARSELYTALRFFQLIDNEKKPTPDLHALAGNPSAQNLRGLVESHYEPVIALNLNSATPRMVDDALSGLGATPATVNRARAFFLNAAEQAGIGIGQMLKANRGTSTAPRRKPRQVKRTNNASKDKTTDDTKVTTKNGLPDLVVAMIQRMPTEAEGWSEEGLRRFMSLFQDNAAYGYGLDPEKVKRGP